MKQLVKIEVCVGYDTEAEMYIEHDRDSIHPIDGNGIFELSFDATLEAGKTVTLSIKDVQHLLDCMQKKYNEDVKELYDSLYEASLRD